MQLLGMNQTKNNGISGLLQNIIYFFNQTNIRDYVINHYIGLYSMENKVQWDGTYYFNQQGIMDFHYHPELTKPITIEEFLGMKKIYKKKKTQFIIFTACILYEGNKVHYLAFVYDTARKILVCFDPGIRLYHKGQEELIPILTDAFKDNGLLESFGHIERIGLCKKKYHGVQWGIQYQGTDPSNTHLPADAFCQLWTICFLVEFMKNRCSDSFLTHWCKVPPKQRESFALTYANQFFSLPYVYKEFRSFHPNGDLNDITQFITHNLQVH